MTTTPRAEALVDLGAIRHNVALLAARAAASGARTLAVVKADAYGHGAPQVARAALDAGAHWLGVCTIDEALTLRAAGITAPILTWLHTLDEDFTAPVTGGVDVTVASLAALDAVRAAAATVGAVARVHLKIDTGLSRNGAQPADWPALVDAAARARADGTVEVVSVWSHLAYADAPGHPTIDRQAARLHEAHAIATAAGLDVWRHLANSAATLTRPDLHLDLVRPGIAVYGLSPVPDQGDFGLRPAMTLRGRVVLTKRVPAGEGVSYGHEWTTPRDTTLALVPVGYADGVPRALGGRLDVWLAGRRRPVVGRVCMDQVIVDCGDDAIDDGAEVVFFGPGTRGEPTAQEWADTLGTISYEIVTNTTKPRVTLTHTDTDAAADPGVHADTDHTGADPGDRSAGGLADGVPPVTRGASATGDGASA